MVVKSAGSLSINTDIVGEFFGNTPHSLSEYYRSGPYTGSYATQIPTSGAISFSDFYGTRRSFTLDISSNKANLNLETELLNAGWNGDSFVRVNINSGVYIYSTSTATPALRIPETIANGLLIYNSGKIMGCGGKGGDAYSTANTFTTGGDGGTAILNLSTNVSLTNYGYIAGGGGGGGGGKQGGGGGGAGGGKGGSATDEYDNTYRKYGGAGGAVGLAGANGGYGDNLEESHASANQWGVGGTSGGSGGGVNVDSGSDRDPVGAGGGGGRVLPGVGVNALIPTGTNEDWAGGYGGGPGQKGGNYGYYDYILTTTTAPDGRSTQAGGGGGGWGAAGGAGLYPGGAAGKAIVGISGISLVNTGTIYGVTA